MSKDNIEFTLNDSNVAYFVHEEEDGSLQLKQLYYDKMGAHTYNIRENTSILNVVRALARSKKELLQEKGKLEEQIEELKKDFQRQKEILKQDLLTDADEEVGKLKAEIKRLEWERATRFTPSEEDNVVEEKVESDNVNHPSHYNVGGIETIDYIESVVKNSDMTPIDSMFFFNTCKYISRSTRKNGVEDLEKARWYLNRWIKNTQEK